MFERAGVSLSEGVADQKTRKQHVTENACENISPATPLPERATQRPCRTQKRQC